MSERNLTLLTDLYELTMMQGYFHAKDANETVIFDAFYRTNPDGNGFAITAGLEQVVEYIENLHFDKEDIDYLRTTGLFGEDFLEYLSTFKFTGDIYAIPEGTVVFPREPLVKVIAPIMQAQLVETAILNIINHQSLIATKTSRIVHAARGDGVMEFGLRRAQGPDAGIYGARAAMIAGCIGTSNVLCGQMFDVPVKGTHAHSWIMSFPDELTAFRAYAKLYPSACILLADTYDTLGSGVPNAIRVFQEMREARGLAYSASAYIMQPNYADTKYGYMAFIATQNDKMQKAIEAFDEIINNMPESEKAFDIAKEALISRLRTERTVKDGVLWSYIRMRDLGLTEPRGKQIFEKAQQMTLADVKAAQEKWVKGRKYVYGILGDIQDLDLNYLKTLGPIQTVTQEEIFGY